MRVLEDVDVRGIGDAAVEAQERDEIQRAMEREAVRPTVETSRVIKANPEGKRALSWIWLTSSVAEDADLEDDPGLVLGEFCFISVGRWIKS